MNFKTNSKKTISIPSKTFLLGEYAVLRGAPALVLTHAPFFTVSSGEGFFHPKSPAGKLQVHTHKGVDFFDPHMGGGGFGGSTAELIGAWELSNKGRLSELAQFYYGLFEKGHEPSGADLCAQFFKQEQITCFQKEPFKVEGGLSFFEGYVLLIYKTQIKVKTHEHLGALDKLNFEKLIELSFKGAKHLKQKHLKEFFKVWQSFSEEQARLGLLHKETSKQVRVLMKISSVEFARGCGALGADVIVVSCKTENVDKVKHQIVESGLALKFTAASGEQDFE